MASIEIVGDINEYKEIILEIKRLSKELKRLRIRKESLENNICNFLNEKDQVGLKYKGMALISEEKAYRQYKKKTDRVNDGLSILKKYGIHNADRILEEVKEAMRGNPTQKTKIKMKKYTDSNRS